MSKTNLRVRKCWRAAISSTIVATSISIHGLALGDELASSIQPPDERGLTTEIPDSPRVGTLALSEPTRQPDAWLSRPGEDNDGTRNPSSERTLTSGGNSGGGTPENVEAGYSLYQYCGAPAPTVPDDIPSGSEFKAAMQDHYPGRRYKFTLNETFNPTDYPYLDGTLIGPTAYALWVMPTDIPSGVEEGATVAYLDVYRQPTEGGYGWAWYFRMPISFESFGTTCVCCDCPCADNGGWEVDVRYLRVIEEDEGFDYNFRISPADDPHSFQFHIGVAYLGYQI